MLRQALYFHQNGRLGDAERVYRSILSAEPRHFDALHLLGVAKAQQGRNEEALNLLDSAIVADPGSADAHSNRGNVLQSLHRLQEALSSYDKALALNPHDFRTHSNRGNVLQKLNKCLEALACYDQAITLRPDFAEAFYNRGNALNNLNRHEEALASYDSALALRHGSPELLYNRGRALQALGRHEEALASYDKTLAIRPDHADALNNRGNVLQQLKREEEALASYDRILSIQPDHVAALYNRGMLLAQLERCEEALASYDRVLAVRPDHIEACTSRGNVLLKLGRSDDALASYDQALAIRPDDADTLYNRGVVLAELEQCEEALASYDGALAARPDYAEAFTSRGNLLLKLGRFHDALASYEQALAIRPDDADVLNNRGCALYHLRRYEESLADLQTAIALNPVNSNALNNLGNALYVLGQCSEALACYEKALTVEPDHRYALGNLAKSALAICDWKRTAGLRSELVIHVEQKKSIIASLVLLSCFDEPTLHFQCARNCIQDQVRALPRPLTSCTEMARGDRKIRVAYLSADFRRHPVGNAIAELFRLHDRSRFEVLGISFGPDDNSDIRARVVQAVDRFHDVRSLGDREIANLLHDAEVDIAVDLMGHTDGARPGILAHRPAPVQVSYLGYPGTTAATFIDYIIADRIVLPMDQQRHYTEKIIHLPDCYLVNDSVQRRISSRIPSRRELGLPKETFVFCAFTQNQKIAPPMFQVWMRLAQAVPGSVLWLSQSNDPATANLCREAAAQGVDPARLIFAPRLDLLADHLARHRRADLYLDTLPYNAHTSASNALWAGLPVLTCTGNSFAGRVGASLLNAVRMPELVTHSLEEYEALALRLATDPSLLLSLRNRLEQNRLTSPLFDMDRYRRNIETAYTHIWSLQERGEPPRSFKVDPRGAESH